MNPKMYVSQVKLVNFNQSLVMQGYPKAEAVLRYQGASRLSVSVGKNLSLVINIHL
jgi:hypothetical protein